MALSSASKDEEPTWHDFANCLGVDPDLFFPERGASTKEAKEVCRGCVVRDDCLEYALQNGEKFGIWGGMSERERRRIRRQRALARAAAAARNWYLTATVTPMGSLGAPELLIILVVILVLFGGAKLPKLARSLGQAQKEFKDGLATGVDDEDSSASA